jgi:hypothetical protein
MLAPELRSLSFSRIFSHGSSSINSHGNSGINSHEIFTINSQGCSRIYSRGSQFISENSNSINKTELFFALNSKPSNENFHSYLSKHCDIGTFNARYKELLDKFLTNYALNTTEKSD